MTESQSSQNQRCEHLINSSCSLLSSQILKEARTAQRTVNAHIKGRLENGNSGKKALGVKHGVYWQREKGTEWTLQKWVQRHSQKTAVDWGSGTGMHSISISVLHPVQMW